MYAFSSSFSSPKIRPKNPNNFCIFVDKYPLFSSIDSSLMSKIFIYVSDEGPILKIAPFKFLHIFSYSLSGSITYCYIPINQFLNICNLVKNDFPAPLVPNIHMFPFLYFSLSNLSIKINELL